MPLDHDAVADLVRRALAEDVGAGDLTSRATVPPGTRAVATITQKAPGVVFGLDAAVGDPQQIVVAGYEPLSQA